MSTGVRRAERGHEGLIEPRYRGSRLIWYMRPIHPFFRRSPSTSTCGLRHDGALRRPCGLALVLLGLVVLGVTGFLGGNLLSEWGIGVSALTR